jgi:hypothetical protein
VADTTVETREVVGTTADITQAVADTTVETREVVGTTAETATVFSEATSAVTSSVDAVSNETNSITDAGVSGTIDAVADTTAEATTVVREAASPVTSPVDTVSNATGSITDPVVSGTIDAVSDTTSQTTQAVVDTTAEATTVVSDTAAPAVTSSQDTVSNATGSITDVASTGTDSIDTTLNTGTASAMSTGAVEGSDLIWTSEGTSQNVVESYAGADSSSTAGQRAPAQSSQHALMSRLAARGGRAETTTLSSVENPAPCPRADTALCALTADLGGVDSLAEAVASIIRSLAFTGFALLPWLAASFMLAAAGALALAESRRRMSF